MTAPQETNTQRVRPLNEPPPVIETVKIYTCDRWHRAKIYRREDLQPQDCIQGTAIIVEPIGTIIIEPNWQAVVSDRRCLILERI